MKAAMGEPMVNRKRDDHPVARKKQAYEGADQWGRFSSRI
jgi:hypothetical protein